MRSSWSDMTHDLSLDPELTGWNEMTLGDKLKLWAMYYWWPTRRWVPRFSLWWYYSVRRFPKPPAFEKDPVARHFGYADGVPPCADGPRCAEHNWPTLGWPPQ